MFSFTRKIDYALVAMTYLAQQAEAGLGSLSARKIAEQFDLPTSLLMNILKQLNSAGLVNATRGINGGYEIAFAPEKITMLDILTVMEGEFRLAQCVKPCPDNVLESDLTQSVCHLTEDCPVYGAINRLQLRMRGFLEQVSLADLMDAEVDVPLAKVGILTDAAVLASHHGIRQESNRKKDFACVSDHHEGD